MSTRGYIVHSGQRKLSKELVSKYSKIFGGDLLSVKVDERKYNRIIPGTILKYDVGLGKYIPIGETDTVGYGEGQVNPGKIKISASFGEQALDYGNRLTVNSISSEYRAKLAYNHPISGVTARSGAIVYIEDGQFRAGEYEDLPDGTYIVGFLGKPINDGDKVWYLNTAGGGDYKRGPIHPVTTAEPATTSEPLTTDVPVTTPYIDPDYICVKGAGSSEVNGTYKIGEPIFPPGPTFYKVGGGPEDCVTFIDDWPELGTHSWVIGNSGNTMYRKSSPTENPDNPQGIYDGATGIEGELPYPEVILGACPVVPVHTTTEEPVTTPQPTTTEEPVTTPEPTTTEEPVTTPEPVTTETPTTTMTGTCPVSLAPPNLGEPDAGEPTNPLRIETIHNLMWLSQNDDYWTKHYIQTDDIDAYDTRWCDMAKGWSPIGINIGWVTIKEFRGTYDGQGFRISNIYCNRPDQWFIGVFGFCIDAQIKNVIVEDCHIEGLQWVGGLVGQIYYESHPEYEVRSCRVIGGTVKGYGIHVGGLSGYPEYRIIDCHTETEVESTGSQCGGLLGTFGNSEMLHCSSKSNVKAASWVGGLVGQNQGGEIMRCYSEGIITGNDRAGGLAGNNGGTAGSTKTIMDCFTRCQVIRREGEAGTAFGMGIGRTSRNTLIKNCYAIGTVKYLGTDDPTDRGFLGLQDPTAEPFPTYENNYWDAEASGQATSEQEGAGKIEARTTAEMTHPYDESENVTYVGWDFEEIWVHDESGEENEGYPYLRSPSDVTTTTGT